MIKICLRNVVVGAMLVFIAACSAPSPSQTIDGEDYSTELIDDTASAKSLGEDKGWVLQRAVWPSPIISVCWEDLAQSTEVERVWVRDSLEKSWEAHSAVDFVGFAKCTNSSRGIRVQFGNLGARTLGLGRKLDAVQNGLRLNNKYRNWNSWCRRTEHSRENCLRAHAVHEFGHALGFAHEHIRDDTPEACRASDGGSRGDRILTPWDPDSIMNYCNRSRMTDGGKLSPGDQLSVALVYGPKLID